MVRAVRGAAADDAGSRRAARADRVDLGPAGHVGVSQPGQADRRRARLPVGAEHPLGPRRAAAAARSATSVAPSPPASSTSASSSAARRSSASCAARSRGSRSPTTVQPEDTPPPDVHHTSSDPWCVGSSKSRAGSRPRSSSSPSSSRRCATRHGLDVERHRDAHRRSSTAASARWRRRIRMPGAARRCPRRRSATPSPTNAMLAFPYTKRHCSQWNVNQAVAILVCSAARAAQLGLARDGWIFPLAAVAVEARRPAGAATPAAQPSRGRCCPASGRWRWRASPFATSTPPSSTAAFPAAIQSFARDLRLPETCPLDRDRRDALRRRSLQQLQPRGRRSDGRGAARAAARGSPRRIGLVSNLSGIFGKQACALFSNLPGSAGYRLRGRHRRGRRARRAAAARRRLRRSGHDRRLHGRISWRESLARDRDLRHAGGARTVVRSDDGEVAATMIREEFCGRVIQVLDGGGFRLGTASSSER